MESFDDILKEMDFDFFGSGEYGMSLEEAQRVLSNDHFIFLDIRTSEEVERVTFPFAKHIPLNELPDRLDELPKDKFIVPFCASVFRAAMAYVYLLTKGYDEVKGLTATTDQLATILKPGPLYLAMSK
jgi:rhodanese-related sulfurtransferase